LTAAVWAKLLAWIGHGLRCLWRYISSEEWPTALSTQNHPGIPTGRHHSQGAIVENMDDAETKHVIGTVLFLAVHCVARKQCHALVPRLAKAQEKPWHALSPRLRFCRSAKCESGTPQNRICLPPTNLARSSVSSCQGSHCAQQAEISRRRAIASSSASTTPNAGTRRSAI
jgi:hypothetical protein